jgi:hypothetical protein
VRAPLAARCSIGQVNTTPSTASNFIWGQKTTSVLGGDTSTEFWFTLQGFENRSYCVEVGNFEGIFGDIKTNPIVVVYRFDLVTIAEGIDRQDEPDAAFHRACWTQPSGYPIFVRLNRGFTSHANSYVTLRFVETTLFCPWFFIAGDYNAFSLLRNTSRTTLSGVIVTWRGLNGVIAGQTTVTIAGTTTVSIPANGGLIVNARDFVSRFQWNGRDRAPGISRPDPGIDDDPVRNDGFELRYRVRSETALVRAGTTRASAVRRTRRIPAR